MIALPLLTRTKLVRQLKQSLRIGHVIITAPPGYGKSTLLHSLLAYQPHSYHLALTPVDLDLSQLQARLQPILAPSVTILLDDVQYLLDAPEPLDWLAQQIESNAARFVLSGRQIPPRLLQAASGATSLQLSTEDLAFSPVETAALLGEQAPSVRVRAIAAISEIGTEETIPHLAEMLATEKEASVRSAIERALDSLETLPPATIRVTMLGEFSATRGDQPITPDDWQRPAARRLFQYFVLNQGKPLPRDRILEELWPDSTPDAARSSFKTVYSWLRKAIEPYLRPKSPSRYIHVDQETYTFNPQKKTAILHSDVAEFEQVVRAVLKEADNHDIRPLSAPFVAALEGWKPLLSELSYEAWTQEARERLQNLYVQGCLYAASAMLDIDKPIGAAGWAERVITVSPWSEEGWQELIRAQARQGNRTLALKSYEAAVTALKRELDAPPSSVLEWLAKRLRADEEI